MPSTFSQLDQSFPSMDGRDTDALLRAVQDYLYQLLEQLRYILNNISPDNFNESEVNGWAGETIVKPIHAEITDVENGLVNLIDVTAQGVRLDLHKECAVEWTAGTYYVMDVVKVTASNGSVKFYRCTATQTTQQPPGTDWTEIPAADVLHSRFDLTASGLRSEVTRSTDAEGTLGSRITQTADAITSEVTRASGAESRIDQKADAIKAQVTDGNGNYTVLNLKSDGLHVGNASGTTTISGGSITTGTVTATQIAAGTITGNEISSNYVYAGTISADQITAGTLDAGNITLHGSFSVTTTHNDTDYACGHIGGEYDSGYGAIFIQSASGDNFVLVDDTQAMLQSRLGGANARVIVGEDSVWMQVRKTVNGVTKSSTFSIDEDGVYIQKRNGTKYNLFDIV